MSAAHDAATQLAARFARRPLASLALAGFLVAAWAATHAVGQLWFADIGFHGLLVRGARTGQVVADGEWWRVFTATWLHVSLAHVALNAGVVAVVGPLVERLWSSRALLVFFGLGALAANLAALADPRASLGASAGVAALIGALAACALRWGRTLPRDMLWLMIAQGALALAGASLLAAASEGVDHAAHALGLGTGAALALLLPPAWLGDRVGSDRALGAVCAGLAAAHALAMVSALAGVSGHRSAAPQTGLDPQTGVPHATLRDPAAPRSAASGCPS